MTWDKENAETDCNVMSVTCDENWLETVLCGLFFFHVCLGSCLVFVVGMLGDEPRALLALTRIL